MKRLRIVIVCLAALWLPLRIGVTSAYGLTVSRLRCEYAADPVGIQESRPRLGWIVVDSRRGQRQIAYRIKVASSRAKLAAERGDLWDTGKVAGDDCRVEYGGKALTSGERCFWAVQVWDQDGRPSEWSEPGSWSLGLLKRSDWRAQWISFDTSGENRDPQLDLPPSPYLRRGFEIGRKVRRATLYVTALGLFELFLNGRRVGRDCFTPGWSDYNRRLFYLTYDVTAYLAPGGNAIGAVLADGWYAGYVGFLPPGAKLRENRALYGRTPALLLQLELEFEDGGHETIISDGSWRGATGPILSSDLQMGEIYDARLEMPGWDRTGFDDRGWAKVAVRPDDPARQLTAYPGAPVRRIEELTPRTISAAGRGVYLVDFGQNFAGRVRVKLKGERGTQVKLRFGEMLHDDGTLMVENLRSARATDLYTLKGDEKGESWEPTFTYHGFRYAEITGLPVRPDPAAITGVVMHSDLPATGSFESSNEQVNRLYRNILWSQRSNYFEIPTDCPQRDERLGWTGDAQLFMRSASYNMDVAAFFTRWLINVNDAQLPSGAYPNIAPRPFSVGDPAPGWMDAGVICPAILRKVYGDTRTVRRFFPAMRRYFEFLRAAADGFVQKPSQRIWGDWLAVDEKTPGDLIATAYFACDARLLAEMADAISRPEEAAAYRATDRGIRRAFATRFVRNDGRLVHETQGGYALALDFDLIPADRRAAAGEHLVRLIGQRNWHLATGFLGTRSLPFALSGTGNTGVVYRLLTARGFPSWGDQIENGATTIWEHWDGYSKDKGFKNAADTSFNHTAFGSVLEWMFASLAGIDTDDSGFHRIVIRPEVDGDGIDWAKGVYDSIRGKIACAWEKKGDDLRLKVEIPANSTAVLYIPSQEGTTVTESGVPAGEAPGVTFLRTEKNRAVYRVLSGKYAFHAKYLPARQAYYW